MKIPAFSLHSRQIEAIRYLVDPSHKRVKEVLFGGAKNGGKSFLGAAFIFSQALTYPGTFYCITRKEVGQLRSFTVPTIMEWFKVAGIDYGRYCRLDGLHGHYTLYNGSRVYLLACTHLPRDPLYERFGSMQFTQGWIEEGGEIPDAAYDNLKLAIGRWQNDTYGLPYKLLITCNPKKNWMYREFYKPWADGCLPPERHFVQSLVTDNIFRQSGAVEVLDSIRDPIAKARLRFGEWEYSDDPNALIEYDAIQDLFTNEFVPPGGKKFITVDVARYGTDKTVIRVWHGYRVIHRERKSGISTTETATLVRSLATRFEVPVSQIIVDEDGVGGGVIDQLPRGVKGFIAGSAPIRPKPTESYENLKAQCAYHLADLVNNRKIFEGPCTTEERNTLTADLEQVKEKNADKDGKRGLISKDKVKAILGRSPDDGDTYIMRAYFDVATFSGFKVVTGSGADSVTSVSSDTGFRGRSDYNP